MDELAEFVKFLGECEFQKEEKEPAKQIINYITLYLFSANAGYITGQAVYFVFDGWFW